MHEEHVPLNAVPLTDTQASQGIVPIGQPVIPTYSMHTLFSGCTHWPFVPGAHRTWFVGKIEADAEGDGVSVNVKETEAV